MLAFFFSVRGRATRGEYLLGLIFLQLLVAAALVLVFNQIVGDAPLQTQEELNEAVSSTMARTFLVWLTASICLFIIAARRCHDIGLPGLFSLLLLVGPLGLAWMAALAILPGSQGQNRYGPPVRYRRE